MISRKRVERCAATVAAICASPHVEHYLIGYTALAAGEKGDQYRMHGFDHFVVLADRMTRSDGLALERQLQERLRQDPESVTARKYHPTKALNVISSYGGSKRDPANFESSVYMTWWEP